ncbi:MAG TPA: zinc ribbon domain-containing protein [Candidatus Collinsella stercoripullorum]|nr:zinc ribbon domain-containing protein [Candidatus Collinsella stercoripullorum]
MFCPKCGFKMSDGARFCPKCGAPLADRVPAGNAEGGRRVPRGRCGTPGLRRRAVRSAAGCRSGTDPGPGFRRRCPRRGRRCGRSRCRYRPQARLQAAHRGGRRRRARADRCRLGRHRLRAGRCRARAAGRSPADRAPQRCRQLGFRVGRR